MIREALILLFLTLPLCSEIVQAQTIAEKKKSFHHVDNDLDEEALGQLSTVNELLTEHREELQKLYQIAGALHQSGVNEEKYQPILQKISAIKKEMVDIQQMWRIETASLMQNESYALWHQPDTTIMQLVMDYGASDYAYLVPPEIGAIRFSLNSNLPIPRESWGDCLELILSQYGIGIRQLNAYLRELFFLRNDPAKIEGIVEKTSDLDLYSETAQLCYILPPSSLDPRGDLLFLQKFSNPALTKIEIIGGRIFITGSVRTIQELLKLYSFAKIGEGGQDFQLITLSKIDAVTMETILNTAFHNGIPISDGASLKVIPLQNLSQTLFLTGTKEEVKKALSLIRDVESQIENPQEKTVYWYLAKHSDAEELATVLAKVYDLLVGGAAAAEGGGVDNWESGEISEFIEEAPLVVKPALIGPSLERTSHKTADGQNNFIVDPKTGAIIMVVELEALPKIKELLKKLDVPKKMVQIEVLLFEKKITNQNKSGLNLLRLGDQARNQNKSGSSWHQSPVGGILEFLISRTKGSGIPAYDLAYHFLLGQEDVQINASPSVTTMNQTPATIAIVEEISIDGGIDKNKNRIYHRSQYGITIQITPIINMEEGGDGFVTLDTDITFDSPKKNMYDRPEVTRRHIKNHVRIGDGQTVILGGLRKKNSQDNKESIPFLGEIPGIGKLFSSNDLSDSSTEMFIFITPKIISDPIEDAERIKREELKKRPGDIPEFLNELIDAKGREKKQLFEGGLTSLFGRRGGAQEPLHAGEYEGN